MKVIETEVPGALIIEPDVHGDARGFFLETWNHGRYAQTGIDPLFVQSNVSRSQGKVLRGLHFQNPHPQGKLVYVLEGEVFDVAVDIRAGSPTFGQWAGVTLSAGNFRQFYVPEGFAHGFCVMSETALFAYHCTEIYRPEHEQVLRWNDPAIGVRWPLDQPSLSSKDAHAPDLKALQEAGALPRYVSCAS